MESPESLRARIKEKGRSEEKRPGPGGSSAARPRNDENLERLRNVILTLEKTASSVGDYVYELKPDGESQRLAPVLRYVATMLLNELRGNAPRVRFVVAVALLRRNEEWRFIVAVNGHQSLERAQGTLLAKVPASIAGIPVDSILSDSHWRTPVRPHLGEMLAERKQRRSGNRWKVYEMESQSSDGRRFTDSVSRQVPPLNAESVWQWHAEQKLLRYVKVAYGVADRKSIVALGISKSPCTSDDDGTNYCDEYLRRKYLRAASGQSENGVTAHWYKRTSGSTLSPTCTKEELRSSQVEVSDAQHRPAPAQTPHRGFARQQQGNPGPHHPQGHPSHKRKRDRDDGPRGQQ